MIIDESKQRKRRNLREELKALENDLVKQVVRLYGKDVGFGAFWEVADKVRLFSELRKNFCGDGFSGLSQ